MATSCHLTGRGSWYPYSEVRVRIGIIAFVRNPRVLHLLAV